MEGGENIADYILSVDEIVNAIKGLGEKVNEPIVVQKILDLCLLDIMLRFLL